MRRRDFLITSSTGAVVAGLFGTAHAGASGFSIDPTVFSDVRAVLYEPRYVPSVNFAREMMRQGARAFSAHDDVVALWRGELGRCLDCAAPRVAGLTLHSDLDILRMCGREQKLRVLSESLHRFDTFFAGKRGSVTLSSWLIGR